MKTETILYTDGHEVTVTSSFLKVKRAMYQLKGITNHGFLIIRPERLPAVIVVALGVLLMIAGTSQIIPDYSHINILSVELSGSKAATGFGLALFAVGSLALSFMKERYAIRIATAEGEKNVIVSRKKEYINQIMDALNHAFLNLVSPQGRSEK